MAAESPIQQLYRHQTRIVDPRADLAGDAEGWIAPVAVFRARHGFGDEAWLSQMPVTVLALRLSGAAVECCFGARSGARSAEAAPTLQPRGTPNHFASPGPVTFAQVYLKDCLVERVASELRPGAAAAGLLRDDLAFTGDPELTARSLDYVRAATGCVPVTALEMEARAKLVVERLLRLYHGFAKPPRPETRLAPWQVKRATDYLEAHLAEDPRLATLAELVGLSPFHFARGFKTATGSPPHRYLIQRRLDRAARLLETTNLPVTEIAAGVGYEDPGYLARLFRKHFGTTPAAWRRARRA